MRSFDILGPKAVYAPKFTFPIIVGMKVSAVAFSSVTLTLTERATPALVVSEILRA